MDILKPIKWFWKADSKSEKIARNVSIGLIVAGSLGTYHVEKSIIEEKARENVRQAYYQDVSNRISEFDRKPGTSEDDWAIAYEEALYENFDHYTSSPDKLSYEKLQKICNKVGDIRESLGIDKYDR